VVQKLLPKINYEWQRNSAPNRNAFIFLNRIGILTDNENLLQKENNETPKLTVRRFSKIGSEPVLERSDIVAETEASYTTFNLVFETN
jgi:hypothetical protein